MPVTYIEHGRGRTVLVEVKDKLTRADYEKFVPRIENQIARHGRINVFVRLDALQGVEAGTLWEDLKFEVKHSDDIRRLAVVGDKRWTEWMTRFSRPFTTAEVELFPPEKAREALEWASETVRV